MTAYIKQSIYMLAAVITLGAFTACDDDEPTGGDIIVLSEGNGDGSVKGLLEVPQLNPANLFVSHWTNEGGKDVMSYCYEFDTSKMHTRWVAYRFDAVTRQSVVSRSNAWSDDPDLPEAYRIGSGYFAGYSRGHICPSADRLYSLEANMQTFYMSNMSPQTSNFNEGIWANLEDLVRRCGRSATFADTLYVVKGGTIDNSLIRTYTTSSLGYSLPVPRYYFTAVLSVKDGSYASIGFLLEHRSYSDAEAADLKPYAMSIDKLEEFTGINFFSNLPEETEAAVEAIYDFSRWKI